MPVEAPPNHVLLYFWDPISQLVARAHAAYWVTPFQVTSWWRSVSRNREVGGHPWSQHLVGLAFDAVAADLKKLDASLRAEGLNTVRYETHVHAQLWPAGKLEALFRRA